jgi:hypothetical protein
MDLPHYHSTGQPVIRQRRDTCNSENIEGQAGQG